MRAALAALAATVSLAGCGSQETAGGGRVVGNTLVVYSLLADTPVARDIVDGEKLALAEFGGISGELRVGFAVDRQDPGDREKLADTMREAIRDPQIAAAIADLDSQTARTSIPLLNAAGILHLSPGATYPGFVATYPGAPADEPGRWQPSGHRTFAPLAPIDPAQAEAIAAVARAPVLVEAEADDLLGAEVRRRLKGRLTADPRRARTVVYAGTDTENAAGVVRSLASEAPRARILLPEALLRAGMKIPAGADARFLTSAPAPGAAFADRFEERFGRCATRFARLGYDAMRSVVAAIERVGRRARNRRRLADAWLADHRPATTFELVRGAGC